MSKVLKFERTVKVDTKGLIVKSADYKDYQIEFSVRHYLAYAKKYGVPSTEKEWRLYTTCLKKDQDEALRKAASKGSVEAKAWRGRDLHSGVKVAILRERFHFINLKYNPNMQDAALNAVYDEAAKVYRMIDDVPEVFHALQGMSAYGLSKSKCEDIIHAVVGLSDTVDIRSNPNEIPCRNYLYNEKSGEKIPYSAGVYLTSHGDVDYDPTASNPHFHNDEDNTDWDFDSWLLDLFDGDPEMVTFFWQIVARLIRPFRPATGIVLFTATTGNNGKGTLVSLFRDLVGSQAWASVPLSEFAERFGLKDLINVYVVLTDENRMEFNFDGADRLKAAADGSAFKVEIRYKGYVNMRFPGLMIQCVNEMPRIKDKTGSWYRRLAVVPFTKSFTGHERKYIKNDYLKRDEVLAYVKKRAIETKVDNVDLHDLMPEKCKAALEDYKIMNDPVRQYWEEISDQLAWDRVPSSFLYDLYCAWSRRNNPSGHAISKIVFNKQLVEIVKDDPTWISKMGKNDTIRSNESNKQPENLILEYDLRNWQNPTYRGLNEEQRLKTKVPERFKGIIRVIAK